ncbi:MAG: ABC transporter ATP-binding protein, partial [Cyclobacteriaceae bacterium]|nr:ABC transporter ATP-binding protein [Cyclobacteriaceae bacterium]
MEKTKPVSGNIVDFKVLKRLLTFVRPYKVKFYLLILLTILLGALAPLVPVLIQYTLDTYVVFGHYAGLAKMITVLVGLLVVQSLV